MGPVLHFLCKQHFSVTAGGAAAFNYFTVIFDNGCYNPENDEGISGATFKQYPTKKNIGRTEP